MFQQRLNDRIGESSLFRIKIARNVCLSYRPFSHRSRTSDSRLPDLFFVPTAANKRKLSYRTRNLVFIRERLYIRARCKIIVLEISKRNGAIQTRRKSYRSQSSNLFIFM